MLPSQSGRGGAPPAPARPARAGTRMCRGLRLALESGDVGEILRAAAGTLVGDQIVTPDTGKMQPLDLDGFPALPRAVEINAATDRGEEIDAAGGDPDLENRVGFRQVVARRLLERSAERTQCAQHPVGICLSSGGPTRRDRARVLRHTYASLLIAQRERLAYVHDQLGRHSIQSTVDTYGHLVPSGNRSAVDRLDEAPQPAATQPQPTDLAL
jgi:hypothetical protein